MTKKRIYDLAKEYGLSGQDLAKKLRDLGFSQVKSHMTALDDFEVLQIQGVLEAHGIIAETDPDADDTGGGLVLRKKKKKKAPTTDKPKAAATEAEEPEDDDEPAPAQPATRKKKPAKEAGDADDALEPELAAPAAAQESTAPSVATQPEPAAPAAEAEPAPAAAAPDVERDVPLPLEPAARAQDAEGVAESPAALEEEVQDEGESDMEVVPAPRRAAAKAPVASEDDGDEEEEGDAEDDGGEATATATGKKKAPKPKRLGKVVGFIDLSKIQTTTPRKTESRRLRSKDDVAPDVRPTMRHDKSRALLRGDRGARGQLSAAELREREAGRFLRRRQVGGAPGGPGAGGAGRGGPSRGGGRPGDMGSPYSGGTVKIEEPITVKKLAERLAVKPGQVLKAGFGQGIPFGSITINSLIDEDTASLLAHEFEVELEIVREVEAEEVLITELKKKRTDIDEEELLVRPPTVAFLGHVDHGKTTLIDAIRNSSVAEGESGGITQHIGAYRVVTRLGHPLTIIDTPGHEAFTAMRARGANAVDIVVLVVAADDGVMPSTEEAMAHARAAEAPIVVALTKMDKAEANPQKVINQLAGMGLLSESLGGDVAFLEVSALKRTGLEELLERVFLESEVLELKCHPRGPASGVVLEAEVQQGKGIVAHLLVQDGTLTRGDIILAGEGYGKVRSMHDDRGNEVDEAPPSMPVEVSGLSALPGVGESFYVVEELARAKEVAEERERKLRALTMTERRSMDAQTLLQSVTGKKAVINVIVRADVQGSVEVLKHKLSELQHEEVEVRVLHAGVGAVTESDVLLGSTSNAVLIAFHVGVNDKARQAAERADLDIRYYEVIYELLDDMRDLMEGTLSPELTEQVTGHAEVRRMFKSSKFGLIAGCFVTDGTVSRDSKIRLLRDGSVVHTGRIGSLRREKDDAKDVREGFECGIVIKDFQNVQEGDVIEAYKVVETKRTLGDKRG